MTDATEELIARFSDPSQWDDVRDGVPIFTEHEAWEVPGPDGTKALRMVLPDQERPTEGQMVYAVDAEIIEATAKEINRNLEGYRKPIKIFVGHSSPGKPQEENPDVIGYGVGAQVRKWGPKGAATLFSRLFFMPGHGGDAKAYPERSPEFFPGRNVITGLALLKTDPRLPMGMMPYRDQDFVVHYGQGFQAMPDLEQDPTQKPDVEAAGDDKPEVEPIEPLNPEEAKTAMRYMAHYEQHHPVMKYSCEQFRKIGEGGAKEDYGSDELRGKNQTGPKGSQMAAIGAKEGPNPWHDKELHHAETDMPVQYAELTERVKRSEAKADALMVKYAESESKRIVNDLLGQGFKIKDPKKMRDRMAKLDDAGRADLADEVRANYAQEELPPVRAGGFVSYAESIEGGSGKTELSSEDLDEVVHYAEKNGIDASENWDEAVEGWQAKKHKRAAA